MRKKPYKLDNVAIRLVKESPIYSETQIKSPEDAINLLGDVMSELDRETICIINLRADGTPINCNFASMGSINMAIACPRELLKSSILSNAASVLVLHNHPSNNISPSREDILLTERLKAIYQLMEFTFVDHIIVGIDTTKYFSFHQNKILESQEFNSISRYQDKAFPEEENKYVLGEIDRIYYLNLLQKVVEAKTAGTIQDYEKYYDKSQLAIKRNGFLQTIGALKDEIYELEKNKALERKKNIEIQS